jgi:hypothetical protein
VNLLLLGEAVSALHDAANTDACAVLGPGTTRRAAVGFLPPLENRPILGQNLRLPLYPVWVVLGKAHYTVGTHTCAVLC